MEPNRSKCVRLFKGKKLLIALMSVAVLTIITGFSVYETTKTEVTLVLDGDEKRMKTHSATVKELLAEKNVDVDEKHDFIAPGLDAKIKQGMTIVWKPAKRITLDVDGVREKVWTTKATVEEVLSEQRIIIDEYSEITPALNEKVTENMNIVVKNPLEIELIVGGKKQKAVTKAQTVEELLKEQNIQLNEFDRIEPNKEARITEDMIVEVIRVEKKKDIVEETVDYRTITRKDHSLPKGKEKVIQAGEKGKIKKEFEVTLENGKEVKRTLRKEEKIKETKDRIVAVGTKQVAKNVSRSAAKASGKTMYMLSTAYTANCSGCSGITATGINLKKNPNAKIIAVDPNVIPLGTKVYVEGYGYAIAADTGSSIRGNKIDVFMPTKSKANAWGRKHVKVKILK